ncbi:MAG: hypothetical protein DCC68_05475 [Planctomycetota bacterium]|nr:MAG: hypothetical protein DCC68_05475 [Planctomycetota bacterium]
MAINILGTSAHIRYRTNATSPTDRTVDREILRFPNGDDGFDARILRFDQAWQSGHAPRIDDYLAGSGAGREDADERRRLLVELVMVDMEYRWRRRAALGDTLSSSPTPPTAVSGDSAQEASDFAREEPPFHVENYLGRFVEFGDATSAPLALVVNEYRVRHRWGDGPAHAEFVQRFGRRGGELVAALAQVDAQLGVLSDDAAVQLSCRCPHCRGRVQVPDDQKIVEVECPKCGNRFQLLVSMASAASRQFGRFDLVEFLGEGAFGAVWKATDPELKRTVAVKVAHRHVMDPELLHEARSAAALQHPGIVAVYEIGRENERTFLVSEFIAGKTLDVASRERPPTFREAAVLCRAVAEALEFAHAARIVHRDLKPANILVDAAGKPHLTDFGLAKRNAAETTVTFDGKLLGAPAYMSPEQAAGEAHSCDARSDVYSLGVILYELLTGELPFRGTVAMVLRQVLTDEPPHPRKLNARIPLDLATICLKCLEKQPGQRYATAKELADDLARYLDGVPIKARPVGKIARTWRWMIRNPLWVALAATLIVSAGGMVGGVAWHFARLSEVIAARQEAVERAELRLRRDLTRESYVADMSGASVQWQDGRLPMVQLLLDRYVPRDGMPDVRDFAWYYLSDRLRASRTWLRGHSDEVFSGAFSADGSRAATGCKDGVVRVFDTASGRLLAALRGHIGDVNCVAFIGGNDWLASGADDGTIRFWDVGLAAEIAPAIIAHDGSVMCLTLTPDGKSLVSGGWDGKVRLWNLIDPKKLREITQHEKPVRAIAFVPGINRLITVPVEGPLRICDVNDAAQTPIEVKTSLRDAYALAIRPDGRVAAVAGAAGSTGAGGAGGYVQLFDLNTFRVSPSVKAHESWIKGVWFIDDGSGLVSVGHDNRVLWSDVIAGRDLVRRQDIVVHSDAIMGGAMSADESRLLTCSRDKTAQIWNFRDPPALEVLDDLPGNVRSLAVSQRGNILAATVHPREVWVWDTQPHRLIAKLHLDTNGNYVALSADGGNLAVASHGKVQVWRVAEIKRGQLRPAFDLAAGTGTVHVTFDPSGEVLATPHDDGRVRYWRVGNGEKFAEVLVDGEKAIDRVTFNGHDRSPIMRCNGYRYLVRRSNLDGPELWRINDVDYGPAFTADGAWMAYSNMDRSLRIVEVATGREMLRMASTDRVGFVAFGTDDRVLATKSLDGSLHLWAVDRGRPLLKLASKGFARSTCIFSPEGDTLYAVLEREEGRYSLVQFRAPP